MTTKEFLAEAEIMKNFHHENVIQLFGICPDPIYIVTEFMEKGSLLAQLLDRTKSFKTHRIVTIATEIANGMAYLASNNLIHRDLATRNVLISKTNKIKIADFGLARIVLEDEEYVSRVKGGGGSVRWMPPEALVSAKFTIKTDVWSFGIVLVELITRDVPYQGMTDFEVKELVRKGKNMKKPRHCPSTLYDIMLKTWAFLPENRPEFKSIQPMLQRFLKEIEDK